MRHVVLPLILPVLVCLCLSHPARAEDGPAPATAPMPMQMTPLPQLSGNADLAFLQAMIPHHQMAVAMAKAELQSGTDPFARELAETIESTQASEIAYMQDLVDHHSFDTARVDKDADTGETAATLYANSMTAMHAAMPQPTGRVDLDFIAGMVPHHEGAIDMAQIELDLGQDALVRELANHIADTQQAQLAEMQDWLSSRQ